jgi:leucyl aminopeptidase
MKIAVSDASWDSTDADTVVASVFEGVTSLSGATAAVDRLVGGSIERVLRLGDLRGTLGTTAVLYPSTPSTISRVVVTGLGPASSLDAEAIRVAAAHAARTARDIGARHLATIVHGTGMENLDLRLAAQATVEGTRLGLYRFQDETGIESCTVMALSEDRVEAVEDGVRWANAIADGVTLARDLVRMPPNLATPEHLAGVARNLADDHGFDVTIGDRDWAEAQGMGAFLAVARAAGHEPRFIVLEHDPSKGRDAPIVLVGKGVTFDSGGLSIKDRSSMVSMKEDMAGAAAVLGTMHALGRLRTPRRVVALVPATENVIDAAGFRPSDVLTAANGRTIEIISTDAEGRLLLADALSYASRFSPRAVVDVATLTGSINVALGAKAAGLFANDDSLAAGLLAAAERSAERLWRMPLWDDYLDVLDSEVADLKNSSGKPAGGACVAAAFLSRFVDYPWAHLDIAGAKSVEATAGYRVKGPTGFGVRLLVEWLTRA